MTLDTPITNFPCAAWLQEIRSEAFDVPVPHATSIDPPGPRPPPTPRAEEVCAEIAPLESYPLAPNRTGRQVVEQAFLSVRQAGGEL